MKCKGLPVEDSLNWVCGLWDGIWEMEEYEQSYKPKKPDSDDTKTADGYMHVCMSLKYG